MLDGIVRQETRCAMPGATPRRRGDDEATPIDVTTTYYIPSIIILLKAFERGLTK